MTTVWQALTIGDVCQVVNGGTPKTGISEYWDGPHLWITPAEMGRRRSPYVSDTERHLADAGLRNSSAQLLPPYSVILSSRAPIGHLVINTESMATNQGCKALIPDKRLHHKFLYYYLSSIVELLNALGTGATFKELSGGKLKEVGIRVPPMLEQQRIVAILDDAFAGIATAKANAEKNLQNARGIFDTHLELIFGLHRTGWVDKPLQEVLKIGSSKRVLEREWTKSGVPFYGGREVVELSRTGETRANAYISEQKYRDIVSAHGVPAEGDILMTARGTIGVGFIVRKADRFYYKDGNLMCLHPKEPTDPQFVLYAFRSRTIEQQLESLTGATVTHLPIEKANSLIVAFPTFSIQERVARDLQRLEAETGRLAAIYVRKLAALDSLKKSVLHRAFAGELTATKTAKMVEAVA